MAAAQKSYTVLVTGASGYLATHVVQQLQQAGHKVRGTVRSLKNEDKVKPLRQLCPGAKHDLELFEADLLEADGWKEAITGCDYVIHTASPFPGENPKDENEVIAPAVEGTLTVLRTCAEVGGIRRVVLTSSTAAVTHQVAAGKYTEADWTDVQKAKTPYVKSKALAEKAAWDFVKSLPEDNKFELATMNPGLIVGPVLCGGWATSLDVPKRLFLEPMAPLLPKLYFAGVDVRDVAAAHVTGMTLPEAAGNRHLLISDSCWMKDIGAVLAKEFKPLGYNVPTGEAPNFMLKFLAIFDKQIKMVVPLLGKEVKYDNSRMTNVLGITPRDFKESMVEMCHSMIEGGLLKKTKKYVKPSRE